MEALENSLTFQCFCSIPKLQVTRLQKKNFFRDVYLYQRGIPQRDLDPKMAKAIVIHGAELAEFDQDKLYNISR
jgi:hypothetical protein